MKYAVVELGGKQFKVSEGEEFLVDKNQNPEPKVLLVVDEDTVKIGNPEVKGAKVTLKIVQDEKGEKIDVFKYKAKSRYRKKIGYRHQHTRLLVEKIA